MSQTNQMVSEEEGLPKLLRPGSLCEGYLPAAGLTPISSRSLLSSSVQNAPGA